MKRTLTACAVLALAGCSRPAPPADAPSAAATTPAPKSTAPAGAYVLDGQHTHVSFRVNHLGFSYYTATFDKVAGHLNFDPANPAAMTVEATIDPMSLDLNAPPAGFHDELMGPTFFEAAKFPAISFKSTKVKVTGADTAKVTGDFTLHGVTRPVTLETKFNGGWAANAVDGARIGFSAHTVLKRSEFGMGAGIPAPGTTLGVGDAVEVTIETEFSSGTKAAPPAAG
jgi:polyisoprenoid-binding protein YceI